MRNDRWFCTQTFTELGGVYPLISPLDPEDLKSSIFEIGTTMVTTCIIEIRDPHPAMRFTIVQPQMKGKLQYRLIYAIAHPWAAPGFFLCGASWGKANGLEKWGASRAYCSYGI